MSSPSGPRPLDHRKPLHWISATSPSPKTVSRSALKPGPAPWPPLRNLAVNALRTDGVTNIAQAIRHHAWIRFALSNSYRPAKEDFAETVTCLTCCRL
jgi:hypothetical protein